MKTFHTAKHQIEVAACLINLNGHAPAEIKLTPAGRFRAKDGRPHGMEGWVMDDTTAAAVIAAAGRLHDDMLIDYEHQTLYSQKNGQPAPAAAWFKKLQWRAGDGLYATDVRWTAAAKTAIESGEYRYISPVISYDKRSGHVTNVLMAALVNYPAIDGLTDLAAAHFNFHHHTEVEKMDISVLDLLGLPSDADTEQVIAKLSAQQDQLDTLSAELYELRTAAKTPPDPAKYVPVETMETLKTEVAQLSAQVAKSERDELIKTALDEGKLLPAQKAWAETLPVASLKAYLEATAPIAVLKGSQTDGHTPPETKNGLTADELAVCKACGIDPEDYKKANGGA